MPTTVSRLASATHLDAWHEGRESARFEHHEGAEVLSFELIVSNVQAACGYDVETAREFAQGWLYEALCINRWGHE